MNNRKIKDLNKIEIQRFFVLCVLIFMSVYLYIKTGDDFGADFIESLKK